jgi:multidrug efflux pump subunit AcrB
VAGLVEVFLGSRLTMLFLLASLLAGVAAIMVTPREEEPQIEVVMADVEVSVPGASAEEVEKLVTTPLERILWQVDGVEDVYSTSRRDSSMVTVRFFVGEERENALVKLYNTINKNLDLKPTVVEGWLVKPVEIDDVPIFTAALHSDRYSGYELRRMGEELFHRLAEVENVSRVTITGGRSREVRVELLPDRLAAYSLTPGDMRTALVAADQSVTAGTFDQHDVNTTVLSQSFLTRAEEVEDLVVGVSDPDGSGARPVYLRDVAEVTDGPEEPGTYSRIGFSDAYAEALGLPPEDGSGPGREVVTLAVAKKPGTNAVDVARDARGRLEELRATVLPDGVEVEITRDYGRTAQGKVDELLVSLALAIVTVVVLLTFTLGWRSALVVALAVPVSFSLSLLVNHLLGYTINRVTLFALILSLGLVVDDPITNVENIQRHMGREPDKHKATLTGVAEVLPPVIQSTLAIIVSFVPLFFITGMMGPYMAPMAANVPLTVTFSTVCALTIVPWMAYLLFRNKNMDKEALAAQGAFGRAYRRLMAPFLASSGRRRGLYVLLAVLLLASCGLAALRLVPLKMLPFDNKNELWIVLDLPEGSSLERTDRAVREVEDFLRARSEVTSFVTFTGEASPMDFNGMVRHSYWRTAPNLADVRVNLLPKEDRDEQSHVIALNMRDGLEAIARRWGADLQLVESPPGPPVMATLVAEIYGQEDRPYAALLAASEHVRSIMAAEPGVADLYTSAETPRTMVDYAFDREKGALHQVTAQEAAETLALALGGASPANLHLPDERQPLPIRLILPRERRSDLEDLGQVRVRTATGSLPLAELGRFRFIPVDQPIHHKNLKRVAYVYAEAVGRPPAEIVLDAQSRLEASPPPPGTEAVWNGEGEWKITVDVFRDMGLAYAVALIGIFVLLVGQTGSFGMPLLIMAAIPLTLLGILPGFWLLNVLAAGKVGAYADPVFFTATSMIGMIALGGIVIRNSLVLIEFIEGEMARGTAMEEAILRSGAVRLRPILLTAATTALGVWPITLDPIFSGLAWALIFGLLASTLFTLVVIPSGYYSMMSGRRGGARSATQ